MEAQLINDLSGHKDAVYALAAGPEAHIFFSSGGDGHVVSWDLSQDKPGTVIARMPAAVYSLVFLKEENLLLAGTRFGHLYVLDLKNNSEKAHIQLINDIFDLKVLPGRDIVLAATAKGQLHIIQLSDLSVMETLTPCSESGREIALSGNGKQIATGWSDHFIRIYDAETFREQKSFEAHQNSVFSLLYTKGDKYLVSGGRDAQMRVWNVKEGYREEKVLAAHWFTINDLISDSSGELLFSASRDKSIRIWRSEDFELLKVLERPKVEGHTHSVNKLLWPGYNDLFISGSDDRHIKVWQISALGE